MIIATETKKKSKVLRYVDAFIAAEPLIRKTLRNGCETKVAKLHYVLTVELTLC